MGHCGRSSYGYLYSLRQVVPLNNKYKLNKSILTAAIGWNDNILYQLKGPKNSKPEDKYHQYILPLFFVKQGDEYLIQGFGSEYASDQDLKNYIKIDLNYSHQDQCKDCWVKWVLLKLNHFQQHSR